MKSLVAARIKALQAKLDAAKAFYATLEDEPTETEPRHPAAVDSKTHESNGNGKEAESGEDNEGDTEDSPAEYGANLKAVLGAMREIPLGIIFDARAIEGKLKRTERPLGVYQVGQVLRKLARKSLIEVVKPGSGRAPTIYVAKTTVNNESHT